VLMCGYESRFITAEAITRLHNWHNKRICEIFRVTMDPHSYKAHQDSLKNGI
jgi:hypothetical protein